MSPLLNDLNKDDKAEFIKIIKDVHAAVSVALAPEATAASKHPKMKGA